MALLAVHISDGVLAWPWLLAGFAVAAGLVAWGSRNVADDEIPRIGLLTAAFFVASLVHVRVGPTSVHLLLNGLLGVILGNRAALAVAVGLTLQALLLGHGGFTTLGINCVVVSVPALLARPVYRRLSRPGKTDGPGWREGTLSVGYLLHPVAAAGLAVVFIGFEVLTRRRPFKAGFAVGLMCVVLTALANAATLVVAGVEDWRLVAAVGFAAHLPLAILEGFVTACAASFLERVQPGLLRGS